MDALTYILFLMMLVIIFVAFHKLFQQDTQITALSRKIYELEAKFYQHIGEDDDEVE